MTGPFNINVVKSTNGHQVQFSIGHQTFSLEEQLTEVDMTSREYAEWYGKQLESALRRLVDGRKTST